VPVHGFDLGALFRSVDTQRIDAGLTWKDVARSTGVAVTTIRRFAMAEDAEADGVLALIGWLGVAPEAFVTGGTVVGEPLRASKDGFVRVDMTRVAALAGARARSVRTTRTTIRRLASVAEQAGCSIASLTRWSAT
jgi:hypothetical protein